MNNTDNFKKGIAELLILGLLTEGRLYGYQIAQIIEERSHGNISLQEGTLYPILYRMDDQGYIASNHELVGVRRMRVYYEITETGKERYETLKKEFFKVYESVIELLK